MKKSTDMPCTEQERFHIDGSDLGSTNAVPRCTEFDLKSGERKPSGEMDFCEMFRPKEQTFTVPKHGNCATGKKNY